MFRKILCALAAAAFCAPAVAVDPEFVAPNTTLFYFRIPLDGRNAKENVPSFGFATRGGAEHPAFNIDSRTVDNLIMRLEGEGFAGLDVAWLVVGGVAATAAVAVSNSGNSSVQQQQQQQQAAMQQQAAQQQAAAQSGAPAPCACPPQ